MTRELEVAIGAAKSAGDIIVHYYESGYEVKDKGFSFISSGPNPVTSADRASDSHLKEVLLSAFPGYGWLSEETVDSPERLTKERVWVIDPLDGTKEFIERIPNFVVSIALVEDHLPVLGVLYNPMTGEAFTAVKGAGAKLNGEPIRCSSKAEPREMVMLNSRSETRKGLWKPYVESFLELRAVGSVSYKLGLTAAGKADVFASLRPKHEWDICAGHCLVNEAGGNLVTLKGEDITYNHENTLIPFGLVGGNPLGVDNTLNVLTGGRVFHG
ncbi:MAG: 3'(2'),5'-bisphosphate nucleotidase CysQ [Fidelibacterota bacterium]